MPSAAAPRTAKGRATRGRIVSAAAELTYSQGVADTSVEEVKTASGVSSSQLYHYFADKHALVQAVIVHQTEQVVGSQEELLCVVHDVDGLRAWADALVAHQRRHGSAGGCPLGSLAGELSDGDDAARAALADAFARWEHAFVLALARMRSHGALRPDADPAALATGLLAALQGGLLLAQVRRDPAALAGALDRAIAGVAAYAS